MDDREKMIEAAKAYRTPDLAHANWLPAVLADFALLQTTLRDDEWREVVREVEGKWDTFDITRAVLADVLTKMEGK